MQNGAPRIGNFRHFSALFHLSASVCGMMRVDLDGLFRREAVMEEGYLEIKLSRKAFWWILAGAILLALVGLGVLGNFYTPELARVIWWTDWTEWKVERQHRKELAQMQKDLGELADILQDRPDPVRAELAAARMEQRHASGLGLLEGQRKVAIAAAQAVRDWAAGYEKYNVAVQTVNQAIEILEMSEHHAGGGDGSEGVQEKAGDRGSTDSANGTGDGASEAWWADSP
jgi:hypothetical protein